MIQVYNIFDGQAPELYQGDIDQTEIERLPEDFADPDREPLETAYGMPFPLDFFRMYECMARLSPNDPLTAFSVVGLLAVGPFEELHKMKRFDGYLPDPECQMKLHMQHRNLGSNFHYFFLDRCGFVDLSDIFRICSLTKILF